MRSPPASVHFNTACLSFLAALAGCEGPAGPGRSATPDDQVRDHFGSEALAVITGAEQAEGYRLEREAPGRRAGSGEDRRLGRFKVQAGPVAIEKTWRGRLEEVLFAAASYRWDVNKLCRPTPGVAIRYRQGDRETHVYLCFECDLLQIGSPNDERWKDFDPARPQLVRLVQELFPGDPAIQTLKEQKP